MYLLPDESKAMSLTDSNIGVPGLPKVLTKLGTSSVAAVAGVAENKMIVDAMSSKNAAVKEKGLLNTRLSTFFTTKTPTFIIKSIDA